MKTFKKIETNKKFFDDLTHSLDTVCRGEDVPGCEDAAPALVLPPAAHHFFIYLFSFIYSYLCLFIFIYTSYSFLCLYFYYFLFVFIYLFIFMFIFSMIYI